MNSIDDIFKKQLEELELEPSERMNALFEEKLQTKNRKRKPSWLSIAAVMVGVLLVFGKELYDNSLHVSKTQKKPATEVLDIPKAMPESQKDNESRSGISNRALSVSAKSEPKTNTLAQVHPIQLLDSLDPVEALPSLQDLSVDDSMEFVEKAQAIYDNPTILTVNKKERFVIVYVAEESELEPVLQPSAQKKPVLLHERSGRETIAGTDVSLMKKAVGHLRKISKQAEYSNQHGLLTRDQEHLKEKIEWFKNLFAKN